MTDKKTNVPISQEKKHKIGNILAVITVLLSILVPLGFYGGTSALFWFLIIVNFLFGPCCFIAYLLEVKRGVFAYNEDEE
ncbi:MAG: hypothetical protein HFE76_05425 [Firmicutes bacterium]|nr:hypothetical protein [Bacillota bacterium]